MDLEILVVGGCASVLAITVMMVVVLILVGLCLRTLREILKLNEQHYGTVTQYEDLKLKEFGSFKKETLNELSNIDFHVRTK